MDKASDINKDAQKQRMLIRNGTVINVNYTQLFNIYIFYKEATHIPHGQKIQFM